MAVVPTDPSVLVGLESAKRVTHAIAAQAAGVHGVLFYGPPGSGKTTMAMHLAACWLCTAPVGGLPCGECRSCHSIAKGRHADFQRILPAQPSNWSRIGHITSNTDREEEGVVPVLDFFRTGPLLGRSKVVLIEGADRMYEGAANALLKTLEEPPTYAKVILTTETLSRVLPTIVSRCVCVVCELPTDQDASQVLGDLTPAEVALVRGSPGEANRLREHRELFASLQAFAQGLSRRPRGEALVAGEEFAALAGAYGSAFDLGARQANAETLELLADYLSQEGALNGEARQAVIEAHRRIVGNGASGIVFDALFSSILGR